MVPFCFPLDVTRCINLHRKWPRRAPEKPNGYPNVAGVSVVRASVLPSGTKRRGRESTCARAQIADLSVVTTQVAK